MNECLGIISGWDEHLAVGTRAFCSSNSASARFDLRKVPRYLNSLVQVWYHLGLFRNVGTLDLSWSRFARDWPIIPFLGSLKCGECGHGCWVVAMKQGPGKCGLFLSVSFHGLSWNWKGPDMSKCPEWSRILTGLRILQSFQSSTSNPHDTSHDFFWLWGHLVSGQGCAYADSQSHSMTCHMWLPQTLADDVWCGSLKVLLLDIFSLAHGLSKATPHVITGSSRIWDSFQVTCAMWRNTHRIVNIAQFRNYTRFRE